MELNEKKFLSVEELSEYLDSSLSTVYKLAQNGEIPAQKLGRKWRFSREKINEWLSGGQAGAVVCGASSTDGQATREPSPVFQRETREVKKRGSNLNAIFTDAQLKTLRVFSLDHAPRLLTALATSTGRKGLEKLLEIEPNELDEIATKLVEQTYC